MKCVRVLVPFFVGVLCAFLGVGLTTPTGAAASEATSEATDAEIVVREIRFTGRADLIAPEDRAAIEAAVVGRPIPLTHLLTLGDRVTLLLHGKGLLLARAYLPPQDVTEGVVEIAVMQGTVGEIAFERAPEVRVKEGLLRQVLAQEIDPAGLTRDQLETALLRMADLPGVSARAWLEAGRDPGTSRLTVDVHQEAALRGALSVLLRAGNAWTLRRSVDVTLADLTGHGDETHFEGVFSEGGRRLRLSRSAPLAARPDLFATISVDHTAYEALEADPEAKLRGEITAWGVRLERALRRKPAGSLRAGAGMTWQGTNEEFAGSPLTEKRLVVGTVTISGDRRRGSGLTEWDVELAGGNLDLSAIPAVEEADAGGLKTAGAFYRLRGDVTHLLALGRRVTLAASVTGQWASKNLDPSQQFSLGGLQGVRAYPSGEARGDDGALLQLEWQVEPQVAAEAGRVVLKAFVDLGWIRLHKEPDAVAFTNACECNEYGLMGAGVGYALTSGDWSLEVTLARALGENPGRDAEDGTNADGGRDRGIFWVAATIRF